MEGPCCLLHSEGLNLEPCFELKIRIAMEAAQSPLAPS